MKRKKKVSLSERLDNLDVLAKFGLIFSVGILLGIMACIASDNFSFNDYSSHRIHRNHLG